MNFPNHSIPQTPSEVPIVLSTTTISPWSIFNRLWSSIMHYPADEFRFISGTTPFSTLKETISMILLYLVVIFGGREIMKSRKPMKLNGLFMVHNFCLTAISGSLLVLFAQQLIPSLWRHGLYENICGKDGWTQPLVVLYYVSKQVSPGPKIFC